MELKTKWWFLAALVCVAVVFGSSILRKQDEIPVAGPNLSLKEADGTQVASVDVPSLSEALGIADGDLVEVGGVKRPKRDLYTFSIDQDAERKRYLESLPKVGRAPSVPHETNKTNERLSKEMKATTGLKRTSSPLISAEAFDLDSYTKDPESYLTLTRPGRVFQSAAPAAGVSQLESKSPVYFEVLQGDSVFLEAKVDPGMPVTFHTQQLGEFDNRLKTISVASTDEGVAKVKYTATTGVQGSVRVMAASPVHSGRLVYLINVTVPN